MAKYHTIKIPMELKEFFQKYITLNPGLGFGKVSKYVLHILQDEAKRILKNHPNMDDYIKISDYKYVLRSTHEPYKIQKLEPTTSEVKLQNKAKKKNS
jgi:hypothetical protein